MDKDDAARQIGDALLNFHSRMDFALGQIEALQVALGTCLGALQSQPTLIAQIRTNLEGWRRLNLQNERSLAKRDGFEATTHHLELAMGGTPGPSVHTSTPGKMN